VRPLGVVFPAAVVTASAQAHPASALRGADLAKRTRSETLR